MCSSTLKIHFNMILSPSSSVFRATKFYEISQLTLRMSFLHPIQTRCPAYRNVLELITNNTKKQ
jgi:hypothetical protein